MAVLTPRYKKKNIIVLKRSQVGLGVKLYVIFN